MLAGGMALGAIASRLVPPFAAQMKGAARVKAGGDPFDGLMADHRHFLSLLGDMERSSPDKPLHRTQLLLRLKRRLAAHALAEEDIVYPLLHDEAREEHAAKHLYGEHADIKIHLAALERMPKSDPEWSVRAAALKQLIQGHARQEETVEFPRLRQMLDQRRIARLAGDMDREKALIL